MTIEERNAEILRLLAERTQANTISRAVARKALIADGIYTQKGKVRAEYGGEPKPKDAA